MKFRYEINDNLELRLWDLENPNEKNAPFLYQPHWPDGTEWADKSEVQAWVQVFIESRENPDSEFLVGFSPDEPKRLRVQPEVTEEETNA